MADSFHCTFVALSVILSLGLSLGPSRADQGDLQDVELAIKAKHYLQAAKTLEPLAQSGNSKAARMLGDLYSKGHGVRRDYYKAKNLWEKAIDAGDPEAMYSLAGILSVGLGGQTDFKRALSLGQHSAKLGFGKAQHCMGLIYLSGWESIKPDHARAVSYFQSANRSGGYKGNPDCLLSFMYAHGFGVQKDPHRAATLMKSARLHGCADAECDIGRAYESGFPGLRKNYAEAVSWYKKAVADGNEHAMHELGWMYVKGKGVPVDNKQAVKLFLQAEKNNYAFAKYDLAEMYRTGAGVPQDLKKAQELYEESARSGDTSSVAKIIIIGRESGWTAATKGNYVRAAEYFQSSAKYGDGSAECWLAHLYENGWGVSKNPQKAAELMKLAKVHGCGTAEYEIGRTYFDGLGAPIDYGKAFYWLSKGVADGNPHAMNYLGSMYADGKGVKVDARKAVELYMKAVKGGCPGAKYSLAECYRTGTGVAEDIQKAKVLYEELAKTGNLHAAEKLRRMAAISMP